MKTTSKTKKTKKTKKKTKAAAKTPAKKKAVQKKTAKKAAATTTSSALGEQLEQRFRDVGGWRGPLLSRLRALILEADPQLVEERKWVKPSNPHGVPTYSREGIVLTLEVYKDYVKVTFAYGSKVPDPTGMFNASLLGLRRAIDIREGKAVDAAAFRALVRAAVDVNLAK